MKREKKIANQPTKWKIPPYTVDPSLDKYKDMNLFPEKRAMANEMLKTAKFPPEIEAQIHREPNKTKEPNTLP